MTVIDMCLRRLPEKYGISPIRDIQVITPIKKGACGVFNMNKLLQEALNPFAFGKYEYKIGEDVFREGDKVMQIRNNYERDWEIFDSNGIVCSGRGMFNGDTGIIEEIDISSREMKVDFDDGRKCVYSFADIDELTLAYAISVHKSQGCEFPFVLMPLPLGYIRIMTRNLFYTAVTRASRMVVLCGSENTIGTMIGNTETQMRYSALDKRLNIGSKMV